MPAPSSSKLVPPFPIKLLPWYSKALTFFLFVLVWFFLVFGCWESCGKENRGNWVENLCFSLFLVSLGLVECEVLSITVDNWNRGFFFGCCLGLLFLLMWNSCEKACWMGNDVWLVRKLGWKRGKGRKFGVLSWQEGKVIVFSVGFSLCLVAEKVLEKKVEKLSWRYEVVLVSLGLAEWKLRFFLLVYCFCWCEIRVRMFVEWGIMFGWLENWVEREEEEESLGFWADRKGK